MTGWAADTACDKYNNQFTTRCFPRDDTCWYKYTSDAGVKPEIAPASANVRGRAATSFSLSSADNAGKFASE